MALWPNAPWGSVGALCPDGAPGIAEADSTWLPLPELSAQIALSPHEVHVVQVALDQPPSALDTLERLLADDERKRAARFRFERDRQRFTVGRGILRLLLGRYLAVAPECLSFCYGPHGKPMLADLSDLPAADVSFNLTHSHGLALFAFTYGRRIGIDVEFLRPISEANMIATHYFSPRERDMLRHAPPDQRLPLFLTCWTRKEAYVKACGDGLTQPLHEITVTLAPDEPVKLLDVPGGVAEAARWSLQALTPRAGYLAGLAVEGHSWSLRCWHWGDSAP